MSNGNEQVIADEGTRAANSGFSEKLLSHQFALEHQDSFNSDASGTSINSFGQILNERNGDPEKILQNLGFSENGPDVRCKIPDRFLQTPSQANGISVEKFVEEHPKLKEYLEEKNAIENPFEMVITGQASNEKNRRGTKTGADAFYQTAVTVAMINRFKKLVKKDGWTVAVPMAEPLQRVTPKGCKYWTVLPEQNCRYLESVGYYDELWSNSFVVKEKKDNEVKKPKFFSVASGLMTKGSAGGEENYNLENTANESVANLNWNAAATDTFTGVEEEEKEKIIDEPKDEREEAIEQEHEAEDGNEDVFVTSSDLWWQTLDSNTFDLKDPAHHSLQTQSNISSRFLSGSSAFLSARSQGSLLEDYCGVIESTEYLNDRKVSLDKPLLAVHGANNCDMEAEDCKLEGSDVKGLITETLTSTDTGVVNVPSLFTMVKLPVMLANAENINSERLLSMPDSKPSENKCNFPKDTSTEFFYKLAHQTVIKPTAEANVKSKLKGILKQQSSSQSDSSGFGELDHLDVSSIQESLLPQEVQIDAGNVTFHQNCYSRSNSHPLTSSSASETLNVMNSSHIQNPLKCSFENSEELSVCISKVKTHSVYSQTDLIDICSYTPRSSDSDDIFLEENMKRDVYEKDPSVFQDSGDYATINNQFNGNYTTHFNVNCNSTNTKVPRWHRTEQAHYVTKQKDADAFSSGTSTGNSLNFGSSTLSSDARFGKAQQMDYNRNLTSAASETQFPLGQLKNFTASHDRWQSISGRCYHKPDSSSSECCLKGRSASYHFEMVQDHSKYVAENEMLHNQIVHSAYVSPLTMSLLSPPSCWSSSPMLTSNNCHQHFIEELKLMDCALHKYKLESKVLHLRMQKTVEAARGNLSSHDREVWKELGSLHKEMMKELESMQELLVHRLKNVLCHDPIWQSMPFKDLAETSVVQMMSTLLREQDYESNLVDSIYTTDTCNMMSDPTLAMTASLDPSLASPSFPVSTLDPLHHVSQRLTSIEELMKEQKKTIELLRNDESSQSPMKTCTHTKDAKHTKIYRRFIPTCLKPHWPK